MDAGGSQAVKIVSNTTGKERAERMKYPLPTRRFSHRQAWFISTSIKGGAIWSVLVS